MHKISKLLMFLGISTSFIDGLYLYWDHFTSDILFTFVDGCIGTLFKTIIGASATYLAYYFWKKFLPSKHIKDQEDPTA